MKKGLIFLESATKKKTIQSFLGEEYVIFATGGHLWELKKSGVYNLGVDLENFQPSYEVIAEKKSLINFWKNYLSKEKILAIYLATDPDREGEAIAQETAKSLGIDPIKCQRLLFYEITPRSIKEALSNPLTINQNLVESQLSRQVLDRMIGFCLSTILQKKLQALSAGRVQSVVLKLIIEREELIKQFEKKKLYILCGLCQVNKQKITLKQVDETGELILYKEKSAAEEIKKKLSLIFQLADQKEEKKFILPKSPLITSLLLFEAKSQLGFSVAQTTQLAQKLYEGVWISSQRKQIGLITYPRTDATRINQEFTSSAYQYIKKNWGFNYVNTNPAWKKKEKTLNVQGAHESIHPTYLNYQPEEIKSSLTEEEYKLYKLIYNHTLASLMSPAQINKITWRFLNNNYHFVTTERICQFAGFLAVAPEVYFPNYNVKLKSELITLWSPAMPGISQLEAYKIEVQEYQENKPVRYNEGSLVQELERLGIGRPSTYNLFGRVLLKRGYAKLNEKGQFIPTPLGIAVNNWLQANFATLINEGYTAALETELDKISQGENDYLTFIKTFWENFSFSLARISK
ncbi:DNA topoisomerase 1 [endosymbiont DhMRE of Dentiscutata heterogama]|uniref:type I DNA topoisomerase n=1 Tax=endosymbiont DhMRE of Dentiscutata heterogama TaxID=1609546 RepID=UPI000629D951|nr:type I DNA topoisomerase [endosymbiont DhMRE of Dentiscutata heterogama]CFW93227.1 DNA topoisomerase 1 [endosymbiont DhMRE of Dentiscutata heterogama]